MGEKQITKSPGLGASVASGSETIDGATGLIRGTIDELERMLDAKHVVGAPVTIGDATIVPLVSMGFGFGAGAGGGGGASPSGEGGQGGGGGGVGGGGIKPLAVIVIENGTVRLDAIPDPPSGLERLGTALATVLERRLDKAADAKDDADEGEGEG